MKRITCLTAAVIGLAPLFAHAVPTFYQRDSVYFIDTGSADFTGALAQYDATVGILPPDGLPFSFTQSFSTKVNQQNFTWTGSDGISVGPFADPGTSGGTSATVTSNGTDGRYTASYRTLAEDAATSNFGNTWLLRDSGVGGTTLEFLGGGTGLVEQGAIFTLVLFLSGNWSSLGTGAGQLEFLGIDPAWSIVSNFVYDPIFDWTVFSAGNGNYAGDGGGPNLHFILHANAAPIPEPASALLLALGLAGLGMAVRHPRR